MATKPKRTIRQKRLAKAIVEQQGDTAKEMLLNVGYSQNVAEHRAKDIFEGEGVKEELKEVYGFDEETAKNVVADILIGGEHDSDRLKAADMIFKVNGSYAAEKHANFNVNIDVHESKEALDEAAKIYGATALNKRLTS